MADPFWAIGDLVLSAKWSLCEGQAGGFGAALEAALCLPVGSGSRFTSSSRPAGALGALGSWRRPPFGAYAGLRYMLLGEPSWGEVLGFRPHNLGFFASLEYSRRARVAWLLQADGMTLPYEHPHPWLGALSGSISFGTRFWLGRQAPAGGQPQRGAVQLRRPGLRGLLRAEDGAVKNALSVGCHPRRAGEAAAKRLAP